jgi:hypothetical protein
LEEGAGLVHVHQAVLVAVVALEQLTRVLLARVEPDVLQRRLQLAVIQLAALVTIVALEGGAHLVRLRLGLG